MLLIVAGNYRQAKECARGRGLPPTDWRYAAGVHSVMGLSRDVPVFITGDWYEKTENTDILSYLRSRGNPISREKVRSRRFDARHFKKQ